MTREAFTHFTEQLKLGNNSVLSSLHSFQALCIGMLVKKSSGTCSVDDAYDIFIDSVLDFRKNVLNGKVAYKNIPGYMQRMCWNKWLALYRQKQRELKREEELKQTYYSEGQHLDESEKLDHDLEVQMAVVKEAMGFLSDKCRDILNWAIVDGFSMVEISGMMGLANANVAKTTKSRCYKKLIDRIQQLYIS